MSPYDVSAPGADPHLLGDRVQLVTERFIAAIDALTVAAWGERRASGGWSASEITEHVALANGGIARRLTDGLTPLVGATGVTDDEIPYLFYRGDEPPNVAAPTGTWTDRGDARTAVRTSAAAVVESLTRPDLDLRAVGAPHPVFGVLDGVQWALFAAAHSERHRAQLFSLARIAPS